MVQTPYPKKVLRVHLSAVCCGFETGGTSCKGPWFSGCTVCEVGGVGAAERVNKTHIHVQL